MIIITWSMMGLVKYATDTTSDTRPDGLGRLLLGSVSNW